MGPILPPPGPENDWHSDHVARLAGALLRTGGPDLIRDLRLDPAHLGQSAWEGDFALLSHRGDVRATLNYANRFALDLWEMDWAQLTATPSEATAPNDDVAERAGMMQTVAHRGFVSGYSGRRISARGRLFIIENVTIWRLMEKDGSPFGAAASFKTFRRV